MNLNTGCGQWHYVYDFVSRNDLLIFFLGTQNSFSFLLHTAGNWEPQLGDYGCLGSNASIACFSQLVFYVSYYYHLTITRWVLISNYNYTTSTAEGQNHMELFSEKLKMKKRMLCVIHPEIFRHITAVNIIRVCLYPTWNGHYFQWRRNIVLCLDTHSRKSIADFSTRRLFKFLLKFIAVYFLLISRESLNWAHCLHYK